MSEEVKTDGKAATEEPRRRAPVFHLVCDLGTIVNPDRVRVRDKITLVGEPETSVDELTKKPVTTQRFEGVRTSTPMPETAGNAHTHRLAFDFKSVRGSATSRDGKRRRLQAEVIVHLTRDNKVRLEESEAFAAKLVRLGVSSEITTLARGMYPSQQKTGEEKPMPPMIRSNRPAMECFSATYAMGSRELSNTMTTRGFPVQLFADSVLRNEAVKHGDRSLFRVQAIRGDSEDMTAVDLARPIAFVVACLPRVVEDKVGGWAVTQPGWILLLDDPLFGRIPKLYNWHEEAVEEMMRERLAMIVNYEDHRASYQQAARKPAKKDQASSPVPATNATPPEGATPPDHAPSSASDGGTMATATGTPA